MKIGIIILIVVLVMSVVTYIAYGQDKKKAQSGKWRTKEKTLLTLSALGGAAGGLTAMYTIRHKNNKWYFNAVNIGSLILHIILIIVL